MTPFQAAVLRVVRIVPRGYVVSYGQVAAYIGAPRAARQVGWTMHHMGGASDFPWWRVLNNAGKITIKGSFLNTAHLQKELLEQENIIVSDLYELDMKKYRFHPKLTELNSLNLDSEYIKNVMSKFDTI